MKISEMVGQTLSLQVSEGISILAELQEIRPVGFLFEVKNSDISSYRKGQHVFLSVSCPFSFSTLNG